MTSRSFASALRRRPKITLAASVLLSSLALVGGHRLWILKSSPQPPPQEGLPVAAVTAEVMPSYPVTRQYTGEVVAGRASDLGFEQGGELIWVGVDRGEPVQAGQVLAKLDSRRLEAMRSQLLAQHQQAQARLAELQNGPRPEAIATARATVQDLQDQLTLARLRRQRRQYLYQVGAISQEERDLVAFNAAALEDRLAAARSQLQELLNGTRTEQIAAQQAQVQQLQARLSDIAIAIEKRTLTAPFAGAIASRHHDEGTIVSAGQPVLRLVEQASPDVQVGLPVAVADGLALDQPYDLEIAGQSYRGILTARLPEVDPLTRTQITVFSLAAAPSHLAPEQLVTLELVQTVPSRGVWLPMTALVPAEQGLWATYALVPQQDDASLYRVEPRQVEVLHTESDRAFVQGLVQAGDRIVRDGSQRLVPGQLVHLAP
ncbi:Multidrug efflux pump subunit [Halomicronema hongdechloris C2206]|uniref:Multidrug efflux pump subunit n=1 Tax=Halomicronema hongdechloris C2206 TaxID=1641165 RepID=A0A1Z3HKT4_9CYAN|nr:HlyD family efflux transporter periplasmic adaptor subunit [Halomicronema hongdechloris]ASC70910.1 Multidrug efflux pump subunit [Halomicronema hongdechloris C2206]